MVSRGDEVEACTALERARVEMDRAAAHAIAGDEAGREACLWMAGLFLLRAGHLLVREDTRRRVMRATGGEP